MRYQTNVSTLAQPRVVALDDRLDFAEKGILLYMVFGDNTAHHWTVEEVALGGVTYEVRGTADAIKHLVEFGYLIEVPES